MLYALLRIASPLYLHSRSPSLHPFISSFHSNKKWSEEATGEEEARTRKYQVAAAQRRRRRRRAEVSGIRSHRRRRRVPVSEQRAKHKTRHDRTNTQAERGAFDHWKGFMLRASSYYEIGARRKIDWKVLRFLLIFEDPTFSPPLCEFRVGEERRIW